MTRLLSSITFLAAAACSHAGDEVALQSDASSDALFPDAAVRKEAGPHGCPTDLPGPPLVQIVVEDSEYCIDAREVTQAQYQQFVAAVGTIPPKSPDCEGNEQLVPRVDETGGEMPFGTCPPGLYDPANLGDYSVVCVDWCDAAAFCAWAGKRLCGALPGREPTSFSALVHNAALDAVVRLADLRTITVRERVQPLATIAARCRPLFFPSRRHVEAK